MERSIQTVNPATGEVIETYPLMSDDTVNARVAAAHRAFERWKTTPLAERAKIVRRIGALLRERADELAELMTREMGKPIAQCGGETGLCAGICDYSADHAAEVLGDEQRDFDGGRGLISYQPIGVILGIQPWNFPVYQVVRYAIASIIAGNAVLLKHAPNVWGTALALERLFVDAGLPEGVFSVLLIDTEQTERLIENDHVRGVTLTGSPAAGRAVGAKAGACLKKSVLELGSNDAYMILEDADLDTAVAACVQGRIYNAGQTCIAAKRFIVVDAIYDEFRRRLVEQLAAIEYGDPRDPNTALGPLARADLRDNLHDQVRRSIDAGATCTLGGEMPDGPGNFYPVTVLENVEPGTPAYEEELFGPVAVLIRVADEAAAIRVANDSRYGLGGGVFAGDVERATRIARDLFDTGMINVNGYQMAQPELPFGGVKDSGYGREHGGFGMREFVNIKSVMITP
ncbi:NAD-dependent succinate-semialdehyde dehydrogenase [Salinisphaera sp.]|uniref:NAD-dependent succinate-semialdehyde dehydrogenase n=1 Tax=Salinisphaera sp. TaxID=1914330 RepID=UPI002D76F62C|nr:NAD-dependent succinate-semialdehyde dehydrogenase [Salinisphaera sp.]HET7315638.1 NAD-dependent succinate-semialdehyde dehydrogenase [Salinisphaera sp.]